MVLGVGTSGVQHTLFANNSKANRITNQATERLATGLRINSGSDDPAGLIGATQLQGDIVEIGAHLRVNGSYQRQTNIQQSGRQSASGVLQQLRGLLVQANNGVNSEEELAAIQVEIDASLDALDTLGETTGFEMDASLEALRSGGSANVIDGDPGEAVELVEQQISAMALASAESGAYQKYTLDVDKALLEARAVAAASSLSELADANYVGETSNLITGRILTEASVKTMALYNKIRSDQITSLFDTLG